LTYLYLLAPILLELGMSFKIGIDALLFSLVTIHNQTLSANLPVGWKIPG
jgi:hypothetical protein